MREKVKKFAMYAGIFFVTFLTGMQNISLPGVYFDAVYPDYLGAVGAFPGHENFTQITAHLGLPLLGNFYHGTITAGIQYLVLKCVGHASIYTLRLVNLFYIAVLASLVFYIVYRVGKRFAVAFGVSILCVTAENIFTLSRTQFYIMLPGAIFFLLSICFLFEVAEVKNKRVRILLAGMFQGLAFYGYFSYLFLAPISAAFLCIRDREKRYGNDLLLYADGILIGSIGFFCGYYDSAVVNFVGTGVKAHILLYVGIAVMLAALAAITVWLLKKKQKTCVRWSRGMRLAVAGGIVFVLAGLFAGYHMAAEKIHSLLNIFSLTADRQKGGYLTSFWKFLTRILSNRSGWELMFGETDHRMNCVWICVWIVMILLTALAFYGRRKRGEKTELGPLKAVLVGYLYLAGYYLISMPLINNMQQQHFVILYFGFFILLGLHLCWLTDFWGTRGSALVLVMIVALLAVNGWHDYRFLRYLRETEGCLKYSKTVDTFIETAMAEGTDDSVYVFPQWGFYANFVYLTSNRFDAMRDAEIDADVLQAKLDDGCKLVIAAWDQEAIDELLPALEYSDSETHAWYSKQGILVFTSVTLTE